jgi:hypothetical protein
LREKVTAAVIRHRVGAARRPMKASADDPVLQSLVTQPRRTGYRLRGYDIGQSILLTVIYLCACFDI